MEKHWRLVFPKEKYIPTKFINFSYRRRFIVEFRVLQRGSPRLTSHPHRQPRSHSSEHMKVSNLLKVGLSADWVGPLASGVTEINVTFALVDRNSFVDAI